MALNLEWQYRIEHWDNMIPTLWFTPLVEVPVVAHFTFEQFTPAAAARQKFAPLAVGTPWGERWQYAWFKGKIKLPAAAAGQRVELRAENAAEGCAVYLDGRPAGEFDRQHSLVPLARKAAGGETWDLLIEAYAGHGEVQTGTGPVAHGRPPATPCPATQQVQGRYEAGIFHEALYQVWMDFHTLLDLRGTLDPDSLRLAEIDQALMDFTVAVDVEAPLDEILAQVPAGRSILRPMLARRNGGTAPEMVCFGHSHIDVAWLWPLRETESKCTRTFANALALMDEYPEYKFLQSQPHLYWMVKERYPDLYARILEKIEGGQWIADGAMWVEADTNISGGESLIRQFVAGQKFYREELGRKKGCELLWLPDVFGYSGALPQIMRGCGVKYFSTQKIYWIYNGGELFPNVTFWWEGIDGSRILSHFHNDYNAQTNPAALVRRWNERPQKMGINARLYPFGYGDGGGGPTRDHLEYLRRLKDLEGAPRARIDEPQNFFRAEEKKEAPLPTYTGELYFQCHRGTYTSQARTKRGNRFSEFALREAELWSAAALARAGTEYPAGTFETLWRAVMLNQFHDVIPGSSINRVHVEAEKAYAEVIERAQAVAADAAGTLAGKSASTFTVFNPLSWGRTALVTLPKDADGVEDADGVILPAQKLSDGSVVAALNAPALGAASFTTRKAGKGTASPSVAATAASAARAAIIPYGATLENALLRARFNIRGEITNLADKTTGRELAAGALNEFRMWKDVPRSYDAWDIDSTYKANPVNLPDKAELRIVDAGGLVAQLEIKRRLHDSEMTQVVRLEAGGRQLIFDTRIDWRERHKLLKVCFPLAYKTDEARHEIQFGHLARPNHANRAFDQDRFEVACQKWSALVEDDAGGAILNDSKYGVNVIGGSINLTLLKAPLQPDESADQGIQEIRYALHIWNGAFGENGPVRPSYELNAPVRVAAGKADFSLLRVENAPTVVVEAVKAAEDGSGDLIFRLYESARRQVKAILRPDFAAKSWTETNMLEEGTRARTIRPEGIELEFRPFEIKTVRFRR